MIRDHAELLTRAERLLALGGRRLLGITGPPGAGKSTVASWLESALGDRYGARPPIVAQVPMDGFHLPNAVLIERGIRDRKGAPDTFDAVAFAALLARLRAEPEVTLSAPSYSRELHDPVAGGHPIPPSVRLVISEGNYLLLDGGDWAPVRALFDEVWFVAIDRAVGRQRLLDRQIAGGKSEVDAREWVDRNDMTNTDTVNATAPRADIMVELPVDTGRR